MNTTAKMDNMDMIDILAAVCIIAMIIIEDAQNAPFQ